MSQGQERHIKDVETKKPPSRSISAPLVCTARTSSASLDNRRRGSLVWAWSGCKCTAAPTLRQVSDVGSGRPHICNSGPTTLRLPFHGAEAAAYALDTASNSLGQFSTSSCCDWRLKRTAPRSLSAASASVLPSSTKLEVGVFSERASSTLQVIWRREPR